MNTDKKDTFEYWVHEASRGYNIAECWQECIRINSEALSAQRKEIVGVIEGILKHRGCINYNELHRCSFGHCGNCGICNLVAEILKKLDEK